MLAVLICLLIFSIFGNLWRFFNKEKNQYKKSPDLKIPLPKNYTNMYVYLHDLNDWNNKQYEEYLKFSELKGMIPMDKIMFNKSLDKKINDYKNVLKDI